MNDEITPSRIGARYVMIITDDATHYRWVYFLEAKSNAIQAFKTWLQLIKNMGFTSPAFLISDNEFNSNEWQKLYQTEGIDWQPANPYSPWQDGVSERAIRIIFERSRALMLDAPHIPHCFWSDAINAATWLTNLLPTSTPLYNSNVPGGVDTNTMIKPSPHRHPLGAWFNAPADFTSYRRWGCPVWVHLHGTEKPTHKLDSHAKRCYLIGYVAHNIYQIWDPEKDTIFNSSDVTFDENYDTEANNHSSTPLVVDTIHPDNLPTTVDPPDLIQSNCEPISMSDDWMIPTSNFSFAAAIRSKNPYLPDDTPTSY